MAFLKKQRFKVSVTVEVDQGGEEAIKALAEQLTAPELVLLQKVAAKPQLKALAMSVAKQHV